MAVKVWIYIVYFCGSFKTSIIILRKDDKNLGLPLWVFLLMKLFLQEQKKYRTQTRILEYISNRSNY